MSKFRYTGKRQNPTVKITMRLDTDRFDKIIDRHVITVVTYPPQQEYSDPYINQQIVGNCNVGKGECDELICIEECRKGIVERPPKVKEMVFSIDVYPHEINNVEYPFPGAIPAL